MIQSHDAGGKEAHPFTTPGTVSSEGVALPDTPDAQL